jgi:hypothetical protein
VEVERPASVRIAAATGLGVAGGAALVVAWMLGDGFAQPTPDPWWTRVGTIVLVPVLAALVWTRRQVLVFAVAVVALAVTVLAVLGFNCTRRRFRSLTIELK